MQPICPIDVALRRAAGSIQEKKMQTLELWGGAECTVNRVGSSLRDQLRESGHHDRLEDIDLFAGLGIRALRFPLLWERIARDALGTHDWSWSDTRLARLRQLNIRPIAGLVHHGSGPLYTNLLADDFATGLASFARAAAQRYPWITAWTPVNEPVTTARFSALYGLWYPHHRDERSFWLALLNQIDGVRLAMAEIRKVNPAAQLIQTDDLGRTYATAAVRDQAAFDNTRRWMGWDLLCGRVRSGHPLWRRLCNFGFEQRLRCIAAAPCPPDIIGVNHYLTSDRFLDHRIQRYPAHLRGGNDGQSFADTEAVRTLDPPPQGLRGALTEAWERYAIPLAVTEVHNGCTREEQMRWMADAWITALTLRQEGIDVRAVTSWSLLGSHGWNTLLTERGAYEPGVYDIREGKPKPTAMAGLLRALAQGEDPHPVSRGEGWWRRSIRFHHAPVHRPAPMRDRVSASEWRTVRAQPILIVGDDTHGTGRYAAACSHRNLPHLIAPTGEAAAHLLREVRCWAVLLLEADYTVTRLAQDAGIPALSAMGSEAPDAVLDRLIDNRALGNVTA
jgi:dTDP-4-dehydrorhamnose reductase